MSSGLRVLADAAHLLADGNSDPRVSQDLEEAVSRPECSATDMPAPKCQAVIAVGKLWLGWIAGREGRLADAARWFEPFGDTGWPALIAGRQAMAAHQFPQAVAAFQRAVDKFGRRRRRDSTARLVRAPIVPMRFSGWVRRALKRTSTQPPFRIWTKP